VSDSMQKQLVIDRLREQLAQVEADRDTLAAEVEAWRLVDFMKRNNANHGQQWNVAYHARPLAVKATEESGALTRAKEAK
jgi:hypothetical protein